MKAWIPCLLGLLLLGFCTHAAAVEPFDLVIENGHVIDGTGSPWYAADIGIHGRTAPSPKSCASTSAKSTFSHSKRRFASSVPCRRSACG